MPCGSPGGDCVMRVCECGLLHVGDATEKRAHHPGLFGLILGLTGHLWLRAARGLHGGARRAGGRGRACHNRAALDRAWRALTNLTGLVTGGDTGRAWRNCGLQDVLRHIRRGGAFRLQHVTGHVGLGRAWGNRRLQHILRPVNLGALCTIRRITGRALTMIPGGIADAAAGFMDVDEGLHAGQNPRTTMDLRRHPTNDNSNDQDNGQRNISLGRDVHL